MTLARAEEVLTDPSLAGEVDAVLLRTAEGYRASAARGSVDFRNGHDGFSVTATCGQSPLADQSTDQRCCVADEQADPWAALGQHATPYAFESTAQFFDSPHSPDLVVLNHPAHRFHGNAGEHGSLAVTQARAPFIAAGAGIIQRGIVNEHLRVVDVAPTIAALLGLPRRDGVDGLGTARPSIRLAVQDGDERSELVDTGQLPDHVVVFLWDGVNPNELHELAANGDAPHVASLIERGTSYRHGAFASLPTATLANHFSASTGVFPGRTGVLHNTWFDRNQQRVVDLLDFAQMINARDHLRSDIETLHEAVHRQFPDAKTATTYEYADRGADYSSYAQMSSGGERPALSDDDRRKHRTSDFMGEKSYRQMSIVDAHSMAEACHLWSGSLGAVPRYSWFTFNLTDAAGHAGGPHSEMAQAAIRDTDQRMGEVIAQIERSGALDRTAIIVLADHGMQETAEGPAVDLSAPLSAAGIDHQFIDAQYVYLS